MQDDIEFFTGENIELQSKVKEVCMHNAQLKIKIAQLLQRDAQPAPDEEDVTDFEVAKNSHEDDDQLGNELGVNDFVSEGSFREEMKDI